MFGKKNDTNWQGKFNDLDARYKQALTANEELRKEKQAIEKDFATCIEQLEEMQGKRDTLLYVLGGTDDEQKLLLTWIHTACQTVASLPTNRKIKALEALRDEAQSKGWIDG
jgi:hypothetical protein